MQFLDNWFSVWLPDFKFIFYRFFFNKLLYAVAAILDLAIDHTEIPYHSDLSA